MKPRVLHLTLYKKWFSLIFIGEKTEEYRERKPYWDKRLSGRHYDLIYFTNGYGRTRPHMTVECKGIRKETGRYVISLGKVLSYGMFSQ